MLFNKRVLMKILRGAEPLFFISPPPLSREGDKGGGLPYKRLKVI